MVSYSTPSIRNAQSVHSCWWVDLSFELCDLARLERGLAIWRNLVQFVLARHCSCHPSGRTRTYRTLTLTGRSTRLVAIWSRIPRFRALSLQDPYAHHMHNSCIYHKLRVPYLPHPPGISKGRDTIGQGWRSNGSRFARVCTLLRPK